MCILVTSSLAIKTLCVGQVGNLVSRGARVTLIAAPGAEHEVVTKEKGRSVEIPMEREPSVFLDALSLARIWFYFIFNRQDLVVVSTPKASLLGVIAARLTLHRNVVFIVRGCAFENFTGKKLSFYVFLEKIVCTLASKVQFVSKELMSRYIEKGFCSADKAFMLGGGSSKGVDTERFSRSRFSPEHRAWKRAELGISNDAFLWMYCGRVRRDKGVNELVTSFKALSSDFHHHHMLLVGPYEGWDSLESEVLSMIEGASSITHINWTDDVPSLMAISDAFVFPSHREGFGSVAIEAAAMDLPVIAFDVTGCRESVKNGVSGLLVEGPSAENLEAAMRELYVNKDLYFSIKRSARNWVVSNFDQKYIFSQTADMYSSLLDAE